MLFSLKPLAALRLRHFCGPPRGWSHGGLADQIEKSFPGILPVTLLGAMLLRDDDDDTVLGEALSCETHQSHGDFVWQRRRLPRVETQLHGRRHLVDVLPTGTRCPHKRFRNLGLLDRDRVGDADHVWADFSLSSPRCRGQVRPSQQQYSGTREILFRKHFAFFDSRLVESINSEKMRGDNRLQHEMHHKFAKGFFTELVDVNGPHRTAILGERLGSGAGFRRHEIANCLARKSWFAREI